MTRPFQLLLSADQIETIIDALDSPNGNRLASNDELHIAGHIRRQFQAEKETRARQEEADAELARYRAERAANATLTKRQAECLAAVRAGKGAGYSWDSQWGRWKYARTMGGARRRMITALIEEGLLTERRELTLGGLGRLEAWEAEHGKIGGEA